MYNLDVKDKKLLYYLLQDSRQSLKTIGKKVGISKELASYRIRNLLKKKIIQNFTILIDWEKLGYSVMTTFYKFVNINPKIKEEIINFLVNSKHTGYVSLTEGIYDLEVDFLIGDPYEFESLIDEIRDRYYKFLSFKLSFFYIRGEFNNYTFLIDEKVDKRELLRLSWGSSFTQIDDLDYNILVELSINSRFTTKKIANKLNSSVSTVNHHIKKLIKDGVIKQFTIIIDWLKVGYRFFHLQIDLSDYSKKNEIINYMRKNPYFIKRFKMLIFDMDLHFTLLLKNMEQLRGIIEDISAKFPNSINDYRFYSTFKICKANYMIPKLLNVKNPLHKGDYI